ncbi:MAG: DNA mismatch repair endonuclease MutL [Thermoflexales bacterium]
MGIHILPDTVVARIAAGEVVERPASVVKELVENAIDAGADDIRVECLESGKRLIRVTDNGSGIRADEAELAFQHHATSKLRDAEDLSHIRSLGFRGEALASIAAVSQVTCVTRHHEENSGTLLRLDGGKVTHQERVGRPPGTTITVEHLFAHVPARLKFLKSNQTERSQIDNLVTRYALAYPHIRFTLIHEGRVSFQSAGSGQLRDVLVAAFGGEEAAQMVPIASDPLATITVSGFASLPSLDHANRSRILLFVNGRPVQDTRLAFAVIQAYHTLLTTGRYPVAVVLVQLPPEEVDVNVHPAKAEVRFRDADAVFSAVQRSVRRAVLDHLQPPEAPSALPQAWRAQLAATSPAALTDAQPASPLQPQAQPPIPGSERWERVGIARQSSSGQWSLPAAPVPPPPAASSNSLPALRILGQLATTYILAEGPEGLYLIDQHAAHERILWERAMAQLDLGQVPSQVLLDPIPVTVPVSGAHLLEMHLETLRAIGFEIERFGNNTFLVRSVPAIMFQDDIAAAIREIVADLEEGDAVLQRDVEAKVLRRVCKRMAIKAGRVLSLAEMQALVRDLEQCESPRTCPHGRPTMIHISVATLANEFKR